MIELSTRKQLLEAIEKLRSDLNDAIEQAGEEWLEQPGSFGPWTFKDLIAHLTGWRIVTARRLEAGLSGDQLTFPWPSHLKEGVDTDAINDWFYETNRNKPVDQVLSESRETFERVERALGELANDDLFMPGRFIWLNWTDEGLGPAVIRGSWNHYYVEHEPDIRAWLVRETSS
jgi:hypothetical protein